MKRSNVETTGDSGGIIVMLLSAAVLTVSAYFLFLTSCTKSELSNTCRIEANYETSNFRVTYFDDEPRAHVEGFFATKVEAKEFARTLDKCKVISE